MQMTNPQPALALLTIFTIITQGLAWTAKPYARFGSKVAMACFCGAVSGMGLGLVIWIGGSNG